MINEDILNSTSYHTYYAYASGAKEPKKVRKFKKHASPKLKIVLVSPKEPTKKPGKAKKYKDFHISHASGSGDGTDFELGVPDEQQRKISDDVDNAKEENKEKLDDAEDLYKDVNVKLKKEDVEMTDANQGGADQHNVFQESGFEQEEEDAHVTLTAVHDTQKTKGPMQISFVSSDFTEKLLNFKNVSLTDNEIASLMDTTVRHKEPSGRHLLFIPYQ
ncbi:hypothetical protein Tco_1047202 [Tanacetum coccineum]